MEVLIFSMMLFYSIGILTHFSNKPTAGKSKTAQLRLHLQASQELVLHFAYNGVSGLICHAGHLLVYLCTFASQFPCPYFP